MDEIRSYIYLDEEAVNSIYAQLRKKIIVKKTIKRIKGRAASLKIGAGLSKLFSIFSGDASANKERSYSTQTEIEYLMLPEDRVDPIIEVLAKGKHYYTELEKAVESVNKNDGSVFINVYDSFSADKSIPENAGYTVFERSMQTVSDTGVRLTGGCVSNHQGPKILWWKEQSPEAWLNSDAFVTLSAFLSMRLCDHAHAYIDDTHLHFTGFADNENRKWDDKLTHIFGDVDSKLPPIVHATQIIGYLSTEAARKMGLVQGIPIAAGCGDTAASALGAGVTKPCMALDVAGTASVLAMSTNQFVPDTKHRTLLFMRSVLDGLYTPLAYIGGGGLCIRWASRLLGKTYDELEKEATIIPLGSNGLQFVPHFAGRVCPASPCLSGAWYGLKWNHGHGEMYRSVLESIAAEYRHYHDILLDCDAIKGGGVVLGTGGGAKSRLFCQIKADALQMDYLPLQNADAALRGSAIVAGMAAGVYNKNGSELPVSREMSVRLHHHKDQNEMWSRITHSQEHLADQLDKYAQEEAKWHQEIQI
ncbi:MAG: hypothetical protein K5663_13120 [Clostridiales bacterium]|nr:hypothetical protein [Clostridiales bacterium]